MSKAKGWLNNYIRGILLLIVVGVVIYVIARNIHTFGNVLLVLMGFGVVVLAHEFGHFVFAKICGIKVEAFSIGFPPTLGGILRTEKGYRIRILPHFFPKENDESGEGVLSFTIGRKAKPSETEYCIGLIPFGGFVKMLGQEDVGAVEASDDPRSFVNKPVGHRMAVIAAGVTFNIISAVAIFMIVFLMGIYRVPSVVGGVVPGSPAEQAGLKAGDEIIEIAGKSQDLDYYNIRIAAALSGRGEKITLKVRHEDETVEDYAIVAKQEMTEMGKFKLFGVLSPQSLKIAKLPEVDANTLCKRTGLRPEYEITAVNGDKVRSYWEMKEIAQNSLTPVATLSAERIEPVTGKVERIESQVELYLDFDRSYETKPESELNHICSMLPRLRVIAVLGKRLSKKDKLFSWVGLKEKTVDSGPSLETGDIILGIGGIENPSYTELREAATEYEDKELPIKVLRTDANGVKENLTVTVVPKRGSDGRVLIGIVAVYDAEHAIVAKTISAEGKPARLEIPRGALITAVGGSEVSSFYDIISQIRKHEGERIDIDWQTEDGKAGSVSLEAGDIENGITVKSTFAEFIPFKSLERLYKASGPFDAIVMGYHKTTMFIAQTYLTIKGLLAGVISPKNLMGPVGIMKFSYRIVAEGLLIEYAYFIGLISAMIAVFNFLPLLPLDGGYTLFLLVEKIKGSPVSARIQAAIGNAGWVLVGVLFIYVTFQDIFRSW